MFNQQFIALFGENRVVWGLVGGIVIALMNMMGALGILVWRNPSDQGLNVALGFAGGVMISASFTSLILPGIEHGSLLSVSVGFALGVLFLAAGNYWVPYIHTLITGRTGAEAMGDGGSVTSATRQLVGSSERRTAAVIVFIVAITLHNMPEGLAVGVSFGSGNLSEAIPLMLAIGIQNIPEGFAVAVAARNAGLGSLFYAGVTGIRAGLVEIPIAVFGAAAVSIASPLLPYAMGFAAGGMLFVIVDEIIPTTHGHGYDRLVTLGTMFGVLVMLALDVALGT